MNTWSELRRDMPPPGYRDHERGPSGEGYGGSPRRFTQMQDRNLSESSEEDEEDELAQEEEQEERRNVHGQGADPRLRKGPEVDEGLSEDEGDTTVTMKSGPRRRSETNASTTSNLRVGFNSLLNPEDRKAEGRVKEER